MTGTAEAKFKVVRDAGDHLWLEIVRGQGKKLRVAVPKRHHAYSEELRNNVEVLTEGDFIEARLVSTNEKNTAWRFDEILSDSNRERREPPVADD